MKIIGIALVILQVAGIVSLAMNGSISDVYSFGSVAEIARSIGALLPGIIGVRFLVKAAKKKSKKEDADR